jgi:hypothetical protein
MNICDSHFDWVKDSMAAGGQTFHVTLALRGCSWQGLETHELGIALVSEQLEA